MLQGKVLNLQKKSVNVTEKVRKKVNFTEKSVKRVKFTEKCINFTEKSV